MFSLTAAAHLFACVSLASLAGAVAVLANCLWPLQRDRRVILALQCAGATLFGVHYLLLGAPTAAAMCAAGVVQGVSAVLIGNRTLRYSVFGATILAGLSTTVLTFAGLPSLCAQTGSLLTATGRLQRRPQMIRWCFLCAEAFWITHNILVGSTWGLTSDTLGVTMLVIGLWRGRAPNSLRRGLRPAPRLRAAEGLARA